MKNKILSHGPARRAPVIAILALLASGGLLVLGVKSATAACQIFWDDYQPTCVTVDLNDEFSYSLGTS